VNNTNLPPIVHRF